MTVDGTTEGSRRAAGYPLAVSEVAYPQNPVLVHVMRGGEIESIHRGAWVVVDTSGKVQASQGRFDHPVYTRSCVKSFQALPLIETGAAERYEFSEEDLALCLSSHNGEPCHTERVAATLERLGLSAADLRCGQQMPADREARAELVRRGAGPSPLHNNCSGKHAGFLALALHLGVDPLRYLDPESESQTLVRAALAEMAGVEPVELVAAIDGCSAPTYRLGLERLALAFARLTNPAGLEPKRRAACQRLTAAAAHHPVLIAGSHGRLCTDLARATRGRLFPKIGAEAVYGVGVCGGDRALVAKIDDGNYRGMHAVVLALLERLQLLNPAERDALRSWRDPVLKNHAGLEVGRFVTLLDHQP